MNFIMLQHGYHRRIIQQAGGEKRLHHRFIWQGSSNEEHINIAGWWCKPAVMMDYHRRLVRRSGGDSYPPGRSYEPLVITIANSFNDIGSDRGVGDRPICSSNRLF